MAVSMRRRFGKWLGITAVFALVPVVIDMVVLHVRQQPVTFAILLGDPSAYLIGFSICASCLGDALFDRRYTNGIDGWALTAVITSILMLVCEAGLYAANKSTAGSDLGLAVFLLCLAGAQSLFTVWTTGR